MIEYFNITGFWKEYFPNNQHFPSLLNCKRGEVPIKEKKQVLAYLKQGTFISGTRSSTICILDGNTRLFKETYIDGQWMWTNHLYHYLDKYDIEMDKEFLAHIKANNFICPPVKDEKVMELAYNTVMYM